MFRLETISFLNNENIEKDLVLQNLKSLIKKSNDVIVEINCFNFCEVLLNGEFYGHIPNYNKFLKLFSSAIGNKKVCFAINNGQNIEELSYLNGQIVYC